MPSTSVEVPALGESVTSATLVSWHKNDGDAVAIDEPLCELETDKANVDVPAPVAGVLKRLKEAGANVKVGEAIARIEPGTGKVSAPPAPAAAKPSAPQASSLDNLSPAVRVKVVENAVDVKQVPATGPGGRVTKEDVQNFIEKRDEAPVPVVGAPKPAADGIRRVPMTRIRKRIAQTLVEAQQTAAILTTFNEVDMSAVIDLRSRYKERFEQIHGISLGFMSFFAHAVVLGLREIPSLNAKIDGDDIVYSDHVHLGIAVSTDRGLAVPVLRNADMMSFAKVEMNIKRLAAATREGKLSIEELSGGTISITNGGIFGSLLSTPILLPPQSGILGMHSIQKRPVAIGDKIEIRPMMYVALSYDHRIVDGKDAITFLVRVKQLLEDPARLALEI